MTTIRHGWYSLKAAQHLSQSYYQYQHSFDDRSGQVKAELQNVPPSGGSIYLGLDGKEVVVTSVTTTKDLSACKWDDVVYVGEVTTWVRNAPPISDLAVLGKRENAHSSARK